MEYRRKLLSPALPPLLQKIKTTAVWEYVQHDNDPLIDPCVDHLTRPFLTYSDHACRDGMMTRGAL